MEREVPEQIKSKIADIVALLKSDELPKALAKLTFPKVMKPFSSWSISNRLITAIDWIDHEHPEGKKLNPDERSKFLGKYFWEALDKADFRGFKQWKEIGRNVQKNETASYILAPLTAKGTARYYTNEKGQKIKLHKGEKHDNEFTESYTFIKGFKTIPVFGDFQTIGKPIVNKELKLPQYPYLAVAEGLGIKVIPQGGGGGYYGAFSPQTKTISMCTPDEATFFHELAHAVDNKLQIEKTGTGLMGGQHADQEVVAQFSANVLSHILGKEISQTTAYTKEYLQHYAGTKYEEMLFKVMSRCEAVIDFITNYKQAKSPTLEAEQKEGIPKNNAEILADKPNQNKNPTATIEKIAGDINTPNQITPNDTQKVTETPAQIKADYEKVSKKDFILDDDGEPEMTIEARTKILEAKFNARPTLKTTPNLRGNVLGKPSRRLSKSLWIYSSEVDSFNGQITGKEGFLKYYKNMLRNNKESSTYPKILRNYHKSVIKEIENKPKKERVWSEKQLAQRQKFLEMIQAKKLKK